VKHSLLLPSLLAALALLAGQSPRTAHPGPQQPSVSPRADGPAALEQDNRIRCMLQGQDSAYWFGSDGQGLYRWRGEGTTLERFTTEQGLPGDHIRGIQEDRSGTIFVCTDPGGVGRFDGQAFTRLTNLDPSESIWVLQPDDLWFPAGQDSGAVFRWDGTSLHRLAFPTTAAGDAHFEAVPRSKFPNAKYSPYDVYTIANDGAGRVWFGTAGLGACRFDGTKFTWVGAGENGSFGVRSIFEEREGVFWLSNNIHRYVEEQSAVDAADAASPRFRKEPGIATGAEPYSVFMSSIRDKQGDLWLATLGSGVFHHDGTSWAHFPIMQDGRPVWIQQIYMDRGGRLWLCTNEHGVYRLDDERGAFERVRW
jgi:ligand-binding sensor domain-containing protein